MTALHIGLDLDNTLIRYDDVFPRVAEDIGLLSGAHGLSTKEEVKSFLCAGPDGERPWMRLQGQVYGRYIERAELFGGVAEFLRMLRDRGGKVSIVSHKTRYGHFDPDQVDLWSAALGWLERRRFFTSDGFAVDPGNVHFEETRDAKIARIAAVGCHLFIDDLPEVLRHKNFPRNVRAIWFATDQPLEAGPGLQPCRSWRDITNYVVKILTPEE